MPIGPKKKHDTSLFLAIVGVLAVPLVYVLQANGVVKVGWVPSLLIYLGIILGFAWAFSRWEVASHWKPLFRYGVAIVFCLFLLALSLFGVITEYSQEHLSTTVAGAPTVVLKALLPPAGKLPDGFAGIRWASPYVDVRLIITNTSHIDIYALDLLVHMDTSIAGVGTSYGCPRRNIQDATNPNSISFP